MSSIFHPLSKKTQLALTTFASMIKTARINGNMSQQELAQRLHINRLTVAALEKGKPTVGIGIAFEAATIVGVPLLVEDINQLNTQSRLIYQILSLLPERAGRKPKRVDDEF